MERTELISLLIPGDFKVKRTNDFSKSSVSLHCFLCPEVGLGCEEAAGCRAGRCTVIRFTLVTGYSRGSGGVGVLVLLWASLSGSGFCQYRPASQPRPGC